MIHRFYKAKCKMIPVFLSKGRHQCSGGGQGVGHWRDATLDPAVLVQCTISNCWTCCFKYYMQALMPFCGEVTFSSNFQTIFSSVVLLFFLLFGLFSYVSLCWWFIPTHFSKLNPVV